jgi:hypothetical protein
MDGVPVVPARRLPSMLHALPPALGPERVAVLADQARVRFHAAAYLQRLESYATCAYVVGAGPWPSAGAVTLEFELAQLRARGDAELGLDRTQVVAAVWRLRNSQSTVRAEAEDGHGDLAAG